MADKTIAEKLLVKPGYQVLLLNPPPGYREALGALPNGVTATEEPAGPADLVQLFVRSRSELEQQLPKARLLVTPKGLLWVTYPKGTSKAKADINRDSINSYANTIGLQGVAMIAVDDTWSALRLKVV